ncbi:MAG: hypothetical protein E7130_01590 [Rikenellaceae bacterium]|nr:hypothetical protein [Rikenellaceae bacterium]
MAIRKILIPMLSMIVLCSCSIDVDYIYYGFTLENKTGRTVTVVWDVNRDCADTFVLSSKGSFTTSYDRYPPVIINSATITFEDGKVLQYSSQDEGRSLCNSKYYEWNDLYCGSNIETHMYTLTEEDYALAVMPSEE